MQMQMQMQMMMQQQQFQQQQFQQQQQPNLAQQMRMRAQQVCTFCVYLSLVCTLPLRACIINEYVSVHFAIL